MTVTECSKAAEVNPEVAAAATEEKPEQHEEPQATTESKPLASELAECDNALKEKKDVDVPNMPSAESATVTETITDQ